MEATPIAPIFDNILKGFVFKYGEKLPIPFEIMNDRLKRIESLLSSLINENNLVCKRIIPFSKKRGKRLYFDEKELTDWIKEGKRKTPEEQVE